MKTQHKGCTQVAINNTLTLPEHKPDIELLLRATSTPCIDKTVVVDKKILFSGHLLIGVEYVACVPDCSQPIHFALFEIPFNGLIEQSQIRACMSAQLNAAMEFQDFQATVPRTINKLVVVKISVVKMAKVGETLPQHCFLPYPTVCRQDKIIPCPESPLPCDCPPEHPQQKCYIQNSHDCKIIPHCDKQHDYENNSCEICGCMIDKE